MRQYPSTQKMAKFSGGSYLISQGTPAPKKRSKWIHIGICTTLFTLFIPVGYALFQKNTHAITSAPHLQKNDEAQAELEEKQRVVNELAKKGCCKTLILTQKNTSAGFDDAQIKISRSSKKRRKIKKRKQKVKGKGKKKVTSPRGKGKRISRKPGSDLPSGNAAYLPVRPIVPIRPIVTLPNPVRPKLSKRELMDSLRKQWRRLSRNAEFCLQIHRRRILENENKVFTLRIAPSGKITSLSEEETSFQNGRVVRCLKQRIKRLKFESFRGKAADFQVSYLLQRSL